MINVTKTFLPDINLYIQYLKKIWPTALITNNGRFLQLLEKKLERYLKVKHLLLVNNGTLALQLALKVLNLKGEVITTPFSFPASTSVITWEGLTPIFADIDPETFNIDPRSIETQITKNTNAILAVHVYGNPCRMEQLEALAKKYNLRLIFDAAHSFAVEYAGQSVLNYGDISILSFHATKVFHTIEGGALIVKDKKMFEKLKLLRNFGLKSEEEVILPGINAKMNEFQAIMGLCNLEYIDQIIQARKKIYQQYIKELGQIDKIKFPKIIASKYNYCYMPVCFVDKKMRDTVCTALLKNNIKPRKYFYPLTSEAEYLKDGRYLSGRCDLKVASDIANRILCLPLYEGLTKYKIKKITNIIKKLSFNHPGPNRNNHKNPQRALLH